MNNPLAVSVAIVTTVWYVILYALSGTDPLAFPQFFLASFASTLNGVGLGVALYLVYRIYGIEHVHGSLGLGDQMRGARLSIGRIPPFDQPQRARFGREPSTEEFPGWHQYKKQHPCYARLFQAALDVMRTEAQLPASPVPGGHGGATLICHSFNVVRVAIELVQAWQYTGHKNKKGDVVFPLLDTTITHHAFGANDPLIPLAAFVHDIGKIACYRLLDNGRIAEVKPYHDVEGARLLRNIPELWSIPREDAIALLLAVGYYHHISGLPTSEWITDRTRSLVEFMAAADIETGSREGMARTADGTLPSSFGSHQGANTPTPQTASEGHESVVESSIEPLPWIQPIDAEADASVPKPEYSESPDIADPLDVLISILIEPNRVNGKNVQKRIAFKHGDWLYINDAKLRAAVAARLGDASVGAQPSRGIMNPWTLSLMERLHAMGALMTEHNGATFSAKRAIFNTISRVEGHPTREEKFILIVSTKPFVALTRLPDCKQPPEITGCSWGSQAAINKGTPLASLENPATSQESDAPTSDAPTHSVPAAAESPTTVEADDDPFDAAAIEAATRDQSNVPLMDSDLPFDLPATSSEIPWDDLRKMSTMEIQGVPFKERVVEGTRYAFFDIEEVAGYYMLQDLPDELPEGILRQQGGSSGKTYYRIAIG